jgi:hypothetical protein
MHYPLQVRPELGKLSSPSLEEASCDGPKPQHRLFVTDASTGTQYLVDTGAEISVLPKHFLGKSCQPIEGNILFAANNTSIQVYGSKLLIVDLKLRRTFKWVFTVADVRKPILGADFLSHYHLLPDLKRGNSSTRKHSSSQLVRYCPALYRPSQRCSETAHSTRY